MLPLQETSRNKLPSEEPQLSTRCGLLGNAEQASAMRGMTALLHEYMTHGNESAPLLDMSISQYSAPLHVTPPDMTDE